MISGIVSHYRIISKIGLGGMGDIYKAEDIKLKRTVALKFLPLSFSHDQEAKKRLVHEAQYASSLDHPNICTIHEIDETDDGRLFIAMSYYEGETLQQKIARGPLEINEVISITRQICEGLEKAHQSGIVHRDIKPANIFIKNDGGVKILDFGLAKQSGQTLMTKKGQTLGTIAYMSPEQARGGEVDKRTDIWSLGVMFYEMLAGKRPFRSDYEQALIYLILNESPEKLTEFRSDIPAEIEKIVTKCITKDASDRYQNIEDLIIDIQGYSDRLPINKLKSNKWYFSKKIQIALLLLVIIGAVFIAGEFFLFGDGGNTDSTERISTSSLAVLPFKDFSPGKNQDYLCEGITEQIILNLSKLKRLKVIARTSVGKFDKSDKTATEIGKELGVQNIIEGSVRESENQIRITAKLINAADGFCIWSAEYDKELTNIFQIQDDISGSVVQAILKNVSQKESDKIKTYIPENQEAYEYYLRGKYQHRLYLFRGNKIEDFNASEGLLKKSIELDSNYALSYAALADLYNTYTDGHIPTAPNFWHYRELQQKYIHIALQKNSESSEVYLVKSAIDFEFNRKEEHFEDVVMAYKLNPQSTEAIFELGRLYHGINLYDKAIEKFTLAIERDPFTSWYYSRRGWSYFRLGKYTEAEKDFLQAIKVDTLSLTARFFYARFLIIQKRFDNEAIFPSKYMSVTKDIIIKNTRAIEFAIKGDKKSALKNVKTLTIKLIVYLLLQMHDEALSLLENKIDACFYYDYGCQYKVLLNDPLLQQLRGYERFNKILESQKKLYEYYVGKYGDIESKI